MNKTIAVLMLVGATACVVNAATDNAQATATTNPVRAASVPKDAVKNPDGSYSWSDKQGKRWIYRKTDTGYVRSSAEPVQPAHLEIPKDAVRNPDGSYIWTDKEGKKWLFRNSPFGVMKTAWIERPAPEKKADTFTKVIDNGDTIKFERPGPLGMGTTVYEKKKSDLTDDERRLYDASKAKPE